MALFCKCDRCGAVIKNAKEVQLVKMFCASNFKLDYEESMKDLCVECMQALCEWLKPKGEHNENPRPD